MPDRTPIVFRPCFHPDTLPDSDAGETYRYLGARDGHDSDAGALGDHTWASVYPQSAGALAGTWGATIPARRGLPGAGGYFQFDLPSRRAAQEWVEELLQEDGVEIRDCPWRGRAYG